MRIYLVSTPDGNHLVEATTQASAINTIVNKAGYTAKPISATELAEWFEKGLKVVRQPSESKAA